MEKEKAVKNPLLAREMEVLAFWEKAAIFKKSVEKDAPQGDYVFYEGPPTANGTPGIHHVLARAFKDVLPRYKTMQGFRVERKAGWDTHGLPVELQVEKELGISGKPDIEKYGIEAFNKKCRESVWRYLDEWEKLTRRIAFWVDMEHPYVTYENYYIESLWRIIKEFHNRGLLYKGHKVVPHCPRCGTALSSHEVAQGYRQVKDNSVYLKFKVTSPLPLLLISLPAGKAGRGEGAKRQGEVFILAWTTTPWTLPGNVALAVGENIEYVAIKHEDQNQEVYILAKDRLSIIDFDYEIVKEFKGKELVGLEYEPLFEIKSVKESGKKAYYVAPADFVTTEDGTGVVHTAVMYGEDDYLLGEKIGLPKIHTVDESGFFKADLAPCGLSGKYVKDPVTEKIILDHLRSQNLLFKEEMYEHDYPFCWRCDSPLLYYAKDSWFVQMTAARADLVANNEKINWVPEHIKTGRFGEWLANVKDWAISRERYWGTPLPVWKCAKCGAIKCVGSRSEIDRQMGAFYIFRHGEAENNVKRIYSTDKNDVCGLTESGRKTVNKSAEELKHKDFELIISSDIRRAKETAEILGKKLKAEVSFDKRLREVYVGDLEGKAYDEDLINRRNQGEDLPYPNGENWTDLKLRVADFYKDMQKIKRKVLIVSHGDTLTALEAYLENGDYLKSIKRIVAKGRYIKKGESRELNHRLMDLHRPYVDEMKFLCACGGEMIRDKSVLDCWFDSGSMPFAQQHYPFENKELIDQGRQYPADFICEAVDQTRGWFYTLHAVATALGRGPSFKNVICLGHINDKYGKKMSKSKGNIINPWDVIGLYGVDAVRLHMYTINAPGEGKNYDLDDVRDVFRKNIMILWNVYSFYAMYKKNANDANSEYSGRMTRIANNASILDKWIVARLNQLIKKMAEELEKYHVYEAAREIPLFINDLSTWYLRRSRERFKSEDKKDEEAALSTLGFVLAELAKVMAPFMPFISEQLWQKVTGYNFADENKSVHLEQWPAVAPSFAKATAGEKASAGKPAGLKIKKEELKIMEEMAMARKIVELGLAKRDEAGIKVRQPLRELRIKNYELRMEYAGLIKAELNVKAITFKKGQGEISVELDTEISEELKLEGMKRELVRAINNMRKEAGLTIGDRIEIKWNGTGSVTETIKVFEKEIMKETLADIILSTNKEEGKAVMINGEKVILEIRKKI